MTKPKANGSYSTVVANNQQNAVESLAAKAKKKAKASRESLENMQNRYGTAMTGVASQAYTPLLARTKAMTMQARARVAQAEAATTAAQQSNRINKYAGPAMAAGQAGVLSRVRQSAQPGIISAQQAISDANAYYKKIGIDLKAADWEAKAALYGQILDQNNAVMMTQFQADLQMEHDKEMYRFTVRQQEKTTDNDAARVATVTTAYAPGAVDLINNATEEERADPVNTVTEWANAHISDEIAKKAFIEMYTPILENSGGHLGGNGIVDLGWLRTQVTAGFNSLYPKYGGDMNALLSDTLLLSQVNDDVKDFKEGDNGAGWKDMPMWPNGMPKYDPVTGDALNDQGDLI